MRDAWKTARIASKNDPEAIKLLNNYIVRSWGRISNANIDDVKSLVGKRKRVSSWSKCLAAEEPDNYFVYDSSISWTLNYIASTSSSLRGSSLHFPLLKGRNDKNVPFPLVKACNRILFKICYSNYCEIIKKVATRLCLPNSLNVPPQLIEMALFVYGRALRGKEEIF
mgnify:CR=1 FL=1